MGYFVEHPGGQRFGPADIPTLNQWIAEGRLIATTILVDAATGAQCYAQDVPGLFFNGPQGATTMPGVGTPLGGYSSQQPINTPYGTQQTPLYRVPGHTTSAISFSYIASGLGIVLLCCIPPLTVLAGLAGIGLAASARKVDPRGANYGMILGAATAILGIAGNVLGNMLMRGIAGR